MALTDAKIRVLKAKGKAHKVSDFGGLYINVTAKGSKLWRLKYRFNGKEGKLSFGPYPDSNPLSVIEQITYLLFIRRLDELQSLADAKA